MLPSILCNKTLILFKKVKMKNNLHSFTDVVHGTVWNFIHHIIMWKKENKRKKTNKQKNTGT